MLLMVLELFLVSRNGILNIVLIDVLVLLCELHVWRNETKRGRDWLIWRLEGEGMEGHLLTSSSALNGWMMTCEDDDDDY